MSRKSSRVVLALVIGFSIVVLGVLGLKLKRTASISPEQRTAKLSFPASPTPRFKPMDPGQTSTQGQSARNSPAVTNEVRHPGIVGGARRDQAREASMPTLKNNGYDVQDPIARLALGFFVGLDPDATEYWLAAINDPELPPEERKDLIEDLNEDGFPDPKHPSPADRPLIVSRLELIESAAPYARDKVNAGAFAEAYKDLVGMLNGEPPQ